MKKIAVIVLCAVLASCLCLFGCKADVSSKHLGSLTYSVPGDWERVRWWDEFTHEYDLPVGGSFSASMMDHMNFSDTDEDVESSTSELESGGKVQLGDLSKGSLGEAVVYEVPIIRVDELRDCTVKGYIRWIFSGHTKYWISVEVPETAYDSYEDTIILVLNSMSLSEAKVPMGAES